MDHDKDNAPSSHRHHPQILHCTNIIIVEGGWKRDKQIHTHTHTHTQCSSTFSMEMFRRKISKISSGIMQRAGNEKEEEDQMRYNTEEKCITGIITLLWLLLLAPEKR
jgi:hypothetical protein